MACHLSYPSLAVHMQGMPQPVRTAKTLAAYLLFKADLPNNAVQEEEGRGKGGMAKVCGVFAGCLSQVSWPATNRTAGQLVSQA